MRELSNWEKELFNKRKKLFESFLEERMPVLVSFVESLELSNASMVVVEADTFLPSISQFMENQHIEKEDRTWIITRIGYFIGEWFVQKYGGCWYLNEIPDTRYFLRYVIGKFMSISNQNAMIDPFACAAIFVDSACPRNLINLLLDVESDLMSC
ncbi:hypothetical protein CA11_05130 [Gimesia maris]|uniref:hypothetical protein n=1 Tax=Gimesia maris TaxID=122 RepID=UPI00118CEC39|nr:hypothetical protein [Gimesia maris]QDU12733.1 hypothetical protein CA11_05130 [Gimesia maris]